MRLEEVYQICKKHQKELKESFLTMKTNEFGAKEMTVIARNSYKRTFYNANKILDELETLSFLENDIKSFRENSKNYSQESAYATICHKVDGIIGMCEMMGYTQMHDEIGFSIKMPMDIDFSDFSKCLNDIQIVLTQCPFFSKKDAKISMKKVDVGSTWIEFVIIGIEAMGLLGVFAKVVDKGLVLWSHMKTIKQQEEIIRTAKLDNQLLETLLDNYKKVTEALTDKFIEEISGEQLNDEDKSRAKLCFDKLVLWFDKGMEIHNAIECDNEVKPVFPISSKWKEIQQSTLKFIDDKNK